MSDETETSHVTTPETAAATKPDFGGGTIGEGSMAASAAASTETPQAAAAS